jgi:hypothetical protein
MLALRWQRLLPLLREQLLCRVRKLQSETDSHRHKNTVIRKWSNV